jgi:hypothetical protein
MMKNNYPTKIIYILVDDINYLCFLSDIKQ